MRSMVKNVEVVNYGGFEERMIHIGTRVMSRHGRALLPMTLADRARYHFPKQMGGRQQDQLRLRPYQEGHSGKPQETPYSGGWTVSRVSLLQHNLGLHSTRSLQPLESSWLQPPRCQLRLWSSKGKQPEPMINGPRPAGPAGSALTFQPIEAHSIPMGFASRGVRIWGELEIRPRNRRHPRFPTLKRQPLRRLLAKGQCRKPRIRCSSLEPTFLNPSHGCR
jgi:hypothetical protein